MNLEKYLERWVNDGLLSTEQAKKIVLYENRRGESSWAFRGLLILGISIIGLGVISLVAANWIHLSDLNKLAANLLVLTCAASWIYHIQSEANTIKFEVSVLFYMSLCLASIGLHSQIFHLEGELINAILLWSFITLPVALLSQQLPVALTWTGGFLGATLLSLPESELIVKFFSSDLWALGMTIPLLFTLLTLMSQKLIYRSNFTSALRYWTVIVGIGAIAGAELASTVPIEKKLNNLSAFIPGYLIAGFISFTILYYKSYSALQRVLLMVLLTLFMLNFHLPILGVFPDIFHAAVTIVLLGLLGILLASLKERAIFTKVMWFVGLRFLILYFQALGGLATSGIGMIFSGVLVIVMVKIWIKHQDTITNKIENWVRR